MKSLLLASLLFTINAKAASWSNFALVSFNQTAVVGSFPGGVPASNVPALNYLTSEKSVNFERCNYRIKSVNNINESFNTLYGGWSLASFVSPPSVYYNLENYSKSGNSWSLNFKTKSEGSIAFSLNSLGVFGVSLKAPLKDQFYAATKPGYYTVSSNNLIIQSACEPLPAPGPSGPISVESSSVIGSR